MTLKIQASRSHLFPDRCLVLKQHLQRLLGDTLQTAFDQTKLGPHRAPQGRNPEGSTESSVIMKEKNRDGEGHG